MFDHLIITILFKFLQKFQKREHRILTVDLSMYAFSSCELKSSVNQIYKSDISDIKICESLRFSFNFLYFWILF